jgi:hypothetical protein
VDAAALALALRAAADLEQHPPQKEFLAQFPARILLERGLLPLAQEDGVVTVASSRLFDTSGLDELRLASPGLELRLVLAPSAEIARCIKSILGVGADTLQSLVSEAEDEAILGQLVQSLANGHPGNVVGRGKNIFSGQAIARSQLPLKDLLPDLFSDLDVCRNPTGAMDH